VRWPGFAGMVCFRHDDATGIASRTQVFSLAESLGGVESLVAHPETMTHAGMDPAARAAAGITPGLLRLSVGIEATEDLLADLDAALARAAGAERRPERTPYLAGAAAATG
jgi:cystathionine gamma-synthase